MYKLCASIILTILVFFESLRVEGIPPNLFTCFITLLNCNKKSILSFVFNKFSISICKLGLSISLNVFSSIFKLSPVGNGKFSEALRCRSELKSIYGDHLTNYPCLNLNPNKETLSISAYHIFFNIWLIISSF